ncbi:Clp protease N-terminal domain-containing protein [Propionicicella superfundia]|uniref:Clp protease N-terminal domain-containing protein n=1 Tax=Propionicicella superfundia TaxID=348582 RepID=UPI0004170A71|nr:Clp protease N-terminal domain-containing protein [Propionicicella superfundia]
MADQAGFRALLDVAQAEAATRSSATVAAEHLLLALLSDQDRTAARILSPQGLTHEAFSTALDRERDHTLARIGLSIPDPTRLAAAPRAFTGHPRLSASAKEAWDRGSRLTPGRRERTQPPSDLTLLVGILSAELGTVPRALIRGGLDRTELLSAAQTALHNL